MSHPAIDLHYRPRSYFWAADLNVQLSSDIKGAERKRMYEEAVESGFPVLPALLQPKLDEADRNAWGRCHPSFMGGEYLPDREERQVEIARIVIDSTTQDVTCVYAKETEAGIEYEVVDEYDGGTLSGSATRTSTQPITLGELVDFFLGAWKLIDCIDSNFGEVQRRIDESWGTLELGGRNFIQKLAPSCHVWYSYQMTTGRQESRDLNSR
ncbi:MAG: hypothetical protein HY854_21075 [Burkholderiales bacterium]|nr:hypothetical protein [Burkholderiales bacterium]